MNGQREFFRVDLGILLIITKVGFFLHATLATLERFVIFTQIVITFTFRQTQENTDALTQNVNKYSQRHYNCLSTSEKRTEGRLMTLISKLRI